jgi:NAD(P)-dependent dehydrogenase (short-subunit alcohol dehydrogenase family)/acyl carrier protein
VAYRGRSRFVPSFEPVEPPPAPSEAPLRPRGCYLITGGLGKVGLAIAAYLAKTVQARLVLTSRTGLLRGAPGAAPGGPRGRDVPPVAGPSVPTIAGTLADDSDALADIPAVKHLESLGADVLCLRADVADLDDMRRALDAARARFGRIDGVVHAAADLGPGTFRPIRETGLADCERQLRPKLGGAVVLQQLLEDDPPDFVLFTSSLSTVLGGLGLAAYAAANHALDAFARRQPATGGRGWMSVCWDGWDFGARPSAGAGERLAAAAISPEEGGEAFARALARWRSPQLVISTTPLASRLEEWTAAEAPAPASESSDRTGAERAARPEIGVVYAAPEDPVDRRLAAIWAEMLGVDRVGADDGFFELGGSSLLAVHMMARVRKEYPVDLSVTTLFEAPTVRALGEVIRSRRAEPPGPPPASGRAARLAPRDDRRTLDAAGQ